MSFGPTTIQPPDTLPFRNPIGEVDNAVLDLITAEIQLINREARIAMQEREAFPSELSGMYDQSEMGVEVSA